MRSIIPVILSALIILAGCVSTREIAAQQNPYDERPDRGIKPKQLKYARDLGYDPTNGHTYDVFTDAYVTIEPEGVLLDRHHKWVRLYRTPDATYITETYFCPRSGWFFGFSSDNAIIDTKTGDMYMLRHIEDYPTDSCFWINDAAGKYVRFTLVYPPLPPTVEKIDIFYGTMPSNNNFDGRAEKISNLNVESLRYSGKNHKILKKKGDIIY